MVQIIGKDVGETGFGLMGMIRKHTASSVTNTYQASLGAHQHQLPLKMLSQP